MRRLAGILGAILIISGCGDENRQPNLTQEPDYFGQAGNKKALSDSLSSSCMEPISTLLNQTKNSGNSPAIEFVAVNNEVVDRKELVGDIKCNEIYNFLSGSQIKDGDKQILSKVRLQISFTTSDAENKQMAQGKPIDMEISRASLEYYDASSQGKLSSIELQCPRKFPVRCDVKELDGHEECISYSVNYATQSCTFRGMALPFVFSDQRITKLDIAGELKLSAPTGAELTINKISSGEPY